MFTSVIHVGGAKLAQKKFDAQHDNVAAWRSLVNFTGVLRSGMGVNYEGIVDDEERIIDRRKKINSELQLDDVTRMQLV